MECINPTVRTKVDHCAMKSRVRVKSLLPQHPSLSLRPPAVTVRP